jgi:chromosomal replication initiator protein
MVMDAPSLPAALPTQVLTEEVLAELRRQVRRERFETWFRGLRIEAWTADEVWCTVPSAFVRDWLVRNYTAVIERAVAAAIAAASNASGLEHGIAGGTRPKPRAVHIGLVRTEAAPREPAASDGEPALAAAVTGRDHDDVAAEVLETTALELEESYERFRDDEPAPPVAQVAPRANARNGHATEAAGGPAARVEPPRYGEIARNESYTFEQFVVGPCNRLAHAAAIATADHPGRAYNPLFIHGGIGLGKSHLLQAIAHAVQRKQHRARVLYLSCEEFTNRYIQAIETKAVDEFRAYHRNADVLMLDDVEFLAGKERTQEEFFHTFNDLFNRKCQIVLSSDRPPPEIPTIEDRLVSRFKWGLVTDIGKPCFETRVAILKRKARLRSVELPDDVAYYVAERVESNIRELEGALITVLGVASFCEREVSLEVAEEALRGVPSMRAPHVALNDVLALITSEFALSAREITGKGRSQAVSFPRQVGMYLSRQHTEHSLEEIGRFFGNRDHTTVLYAVQKIAERAGKDRVVKDLLQSLSQRLRR